LYNFLTDAAMRNAPSVIPFPFDELEALLEQKSRRTPSMQESNNLKFQLNQEKSLKSQVNKDQRLQSSANYKAQDIQQLRLQNPIRYTETLYADASVRIPPSLATAATMNNNSPLEALAALSPMMLEQNESFSLSTNSRPTSLHNSTGSLKIDIGDL
jgi:hypothetical protein